MIKEKDFIELEYTGKLKEDNIVFDTTDEKTAKDNELFDEKAEYRPITVCVGQGQVIKGLDKALVGKDLEKEYIIEISPEEAYGKKSAKLIQLVPTSRFRKENIQPMPGMQVNIDGMTGLIKTVSGGRTLVDFNHPLSGKDLVYSIKVNRVIKDDKEKISSILKMTLGINDAEIDIKEKKASMKTKQEIPKEIHGQLKDKIKELIPGLKEITILKSENLNISEPAKKAEGG
ncbi:peptidylprolyl isomerase [Candidatus Woesearchaeota archaeon]|nr:peptidylprolyl isomerase [Candidatus Woesearchaeota archaeon]